MLLNYGDGGFRGDRYRDSCVLPALRVLTEHMSRAGISGRSRLDQRVLPA